VTDKDRASGAIYPPFDRIRDISAHVARAVASKAYELNLARELPRPLDLLGSARSMMYRTDYSRYR
ncbi:hypothetical protein CYMTET_36852, partial [Cymbomonas tetramitiformis]